MYDHIRAVLNIVKVQIESKSQLLASEAVKGLSCFKYCQSTN